MGAVQSSSNYLENITEIITNIIQENVQTCQVTENQAQSIIARGCKNVIIRNIDWSQIIAVDFQCMQRGDLNAKIATELQTQLDQLAAAKLSGMDWHFFTSQSASNFTKNHARLATEIINRITQVCTTNIGQVQDIICEGSENFIVEGDTRRQVAKSIFKCAQESETITDITNDISIFIKQTAISENKGTLGDIIFILLLIGIFVIVVMMLKNGNWKVIAIGIPLILIMLYFVIASRTNRWPFKSKFDDKKRQPDPPVPDPPKPVAVQQYEAELEAQAAEQARLRHDQLWGQAELGLNRPSVTPEQYRQLKYGDAQIAFDSPFGTPHAVRGCALEGRNLPQGGRPVRLAKPIIV